MPPTYRRRVDGNHAEVRDALRESGWTITDYSRVGSGIPDLLAYRNTDDGIWSCWVEVKQIGEKLTEAEREFFSFAPGRKMVVTGGEEAVTALNSLWLGYGD